VLIVVLALVLSSSGGSSTPKALGSGVTTAPAPSASASGTSSLTRQQAATALSGLLAQSGTDHADVNAAYTNVAACKSLAGDAKTFDQAAANRQALLTKLARLPGRSALSPAMLAELTSAWQASATDDTDLAKWAADGISGCKKNNTKDPNYAASKPFNDKATNDKIEFVRQWNAVAKKYSLTAYQWSQI
jgi:hypothetical protein